MIRQGSQAAGLLSLGSRLNQTIVRRYPSFQLLSFHSTSLPLESCYSPRLPTSQKLQLQCSRVKLLVRNLYVNPSPRVALTGAGRDVKAQGLLEVFRKKSWLSPGNFRERSRKFSGKKTWKFSGKIMEIFRKNRGKFPEKILENFRKILGDLSEKILKIFEKNHGNFPEKILEIFLEILGDFSEKNPENFREKSWKFSRKISGKNHGNFREKIEEIFQKIFGYFFNNPAAVTCFTLIGISFYMGNAIEKTSPSAVRYLTARGEVFFKRKNFSSKILRNFPSKSSKIFLQKP